MNRLMKYVWIALVVAAAGCSKGDGTDEAPVPGGVSGTGGPVPEGMVSMTLDLSADGRLTAAAVPGSKADTRSGIPDETAVGDLWMLQFDTEASSEGSLIHRAYVPAQDIKQSGMTLTASVLLRASANSVIVVVANAPESFTVSTLPDGTKLTELRARTFAVSATAGTSLPGDASARLPMFGETEQMAVSLVGSRSFPVKLKRLAARVSLTLVNSFTSGYPRLELTSVTLRNAPTKIAYGPLTETTAYLGDVFPAASADNFRNYISQTTGLTGTETSCLWYVAPNRRGTGTATKAEDKSALTAPEGQGNYCTYVAIQGRVTMSEGASSRNVTYNVYLGCNNTDDYNLWANAAYSARLTITGFNEDKLEVGYDGFGILVGALDGIADNTITGWHPETGLEYIPSFLAFAPGQIDFGDAETPGAQKVTFRINSSWRFSYTSGDAAKVVASSSVTAGTDQTGGAQGEPAECEVTFSPVIYKAQSGTPVAGTQYNTVATFTTVGGTPANIRTTLLLRTVPAFYGEPAVSPSPGVLSRTGATVTATLASNARWSLSANPGGTVTQLGGSYGSRSLKTTVSANNTWESRTIKVSVLYGGKQKEWSYTQPGMSISGVTLSPEPTKGIPANGAEYVVTVRGDFDNLRVRAASGNATFVDFSVKPGQSANFLVPANTSGNGSRTITFSYYKESEKRWVAFGRGTQQAMSRDIAVGDFINGGVVYWINPTDKTDYRIVALDESSRAWSSSLGYYLKLSDQADGSVWSAGAKAYSDKRTNGASGNFARDFPAFAYCYNKTDGGVARGTWYLPSIQELSELHKAANSVGPVIETHGGTALQANRYWSATEPSYGSKNYYVWYRHFGNGHNYFGNNSVKTNALNVRCVRKGQ